jgi:hypothetical protein
MNQEQINEYKAMSNLARLKMAKSLGLRPEQMATTADVVQRESIRDDVHAVMTRHQVGYNSSLSFHTKKVEFTIWWEAEDKGEALTEDIGNIEGLSILGAESRIDTSSALAGISIWINTVRLAIF